MCVIRYIFLLCGCFTVRTLAQAQSLPLENIDETDLKNVWMLGTEVKLLIFKLGVEYTNMFNTSSYNGKLSFYF